jgi:hypothetical protein
MLDCSLSFFCISVKLGALPETVPGIDAARISLANPFPVAELILVSLLPVTYPLLAAVLAHRLGKKPKLASRASFCFCAIVVASY